MFSLPSKPSHNDRYNYTNWHLHPEMLLFFSLISGFNLFEHDDKKLQWQTETGSRWLPKADFVDAFPTTHPWIYVGGLRLATVAVFMPGKQANSTNQIGSLSHPFLPESWLLNTSQHSIELLNYFLVAFKHSLRTRAVRKQSSTSLLVFHLEFQ